MIERLLARFGYIKADRVEFPSGTPDPFEIPVIVAPEPVDEFKLTTHEIYSALWTKLAKYYQYRLHVLRLRNDSPGLTHEETLRLRGEIKAVKNLLALGNTDPGVGPAPE